MSAQAAAASQIQIKIEIPWRVRGERSQQEERNVQKNRNEAIQQ